MSVNILLATLTLPSDGTGTDKPLVQLVWPGGKVERFTLHEHDWANDIWDWRNGRLPSSLMGRLKSQHFAEGTILHGERAVYISPANVGLEGCNETGRLMVYEVEYEA